MLCYGQLCGYAVTAVYMSHTCLYNIIQELMIGNGSIFSLNIFPMSKPEVPKEAVCR